MDILQKLVRVNSLLLQGAYQGAEHVLDGAIVEARALIEENAESKQQITAYDIAFDNMAAERERLMAQEPMAWMIDRDGYVSATVSKDVVSDWKDSGEIVISLYAKPVPAQQSPAVAVRDVLDMTFYGNETLSGAVKMVDPSPRITEQDAREIARSAVVNFMTTKVDNSKDWFNSVGRALLNKLNGDES